MMLNIAQTNSTRLCFNVVWSCKGDSILRTSQAVPNLSTNRALRRLTSEVRRDPVHSTRYGRQRNTPQRSTYATSQNVRLALQSPSHSAAYRLAPCHSHDTQLNFKMVLMAGSVVSATSG